MLPKVQRSRTQPRQCCQMTSESKGHFEPVSPIPIQLISFKNILKNIENFKTSTKLFKMLSWFQEKSSLIDVFSLSCLLLPHPSKEAHRMHRNRSVFLCTLCARAYCTVYCRVFVRLLRIRTTIKMLMSKLESWYSGVFIVCLSEWQLCQCFYTEQNNNPLLIQNLSKFWWLA